MRKMSLMMVGVVALLAGVALVIWGYNIEPTVGEAFSNVFDGEFTDKQNILKFAGIALCVVGAASLAGAVFVRGSASTA